MRRVAKKAGLPTADKKDSQGICFLGQVSIADFLKEYIPTKRGEIFTVAGNKIGEHDGAHLYTIGQRHMGVDFSFPRTGNAVERQPLYVSSKDIIKNTVTVAEGNEHSALYKQEVTLASVNWITGVERAFSGMVYARVRYRQPLARATLMYADNAQMNADYPRESASKSATIRVVFDEPIKFVAVGQSAVFYSEKGEAIGGGIIVNAT